MKRHQLDSLVEGIIRRVIREYNSTLSALGDDVQNNSLNPVGDILSPADKARQEREMDHQRLEKIKQKEGELKTAKKEQDFQEKNAKRLKQTELPDLDKQIKSLKSPEFKI